MAGMTLDSRDTAMLQQIVAECAASTAETPLPWPVLELLGQLVPSDELSLQGLDSSAPGHYLAQWIEEDARWLEVPATPVDVEGDSDAFWEHYWTTSCSYPERTGDFARVVKLSDFYTVPQWLQQPMRVDYLTMVKWELMLAFDDGGPRTVRMPFFRFSGSDYTERERFLLGLLRPHLEQCYRLWQRAQRRPTPLTPRQRELVELVGEGLSNRQIARRMGLSEGTVRTHLANVYERLGVNSRTAAVMQVLDLRTTVPEQRRRLTVGQVA